MKAANVIIYTGAVNAGKTTALLNWARDKEGLGGFLAPDIDGLRRLFFLREGRRMPFQLTAEAALQSNAADKVTISHFSFSAAAFARARKTLIEDQHKGLEWIIVDEVGKLELKGAGLEPELEVLVRAFRDGKADGKLLLVVRETLVEAVVDRYGLEEYRVIRLGDPLP